MTSWEPGTELPALAVEPISRTTLALFAGASGDGNPIHIDLDVARSAGLDDVFAHGMLSMAYLGRLLTDEELKICIDSGRFVLLKDVSCELATVKRRVASAEGSPLAIINANAAIAYDAMLSGARGFAGVFTNVHPDLYKWLRTSGPQHPELAEEINTFLVIAAVSEVLGYPALAKMYHQRIGTFNSIRCRVITYDVREKFWALDAVLDKIVAGTEAMRGKIARLPA